MSSDPKSNGGGISGGRFRSRVEHYLYSGDKKHVAAGIAIITAIFGVPWFLMSRGLVEGGFLSGFVLGEARFGTLEMTHLLFADDTLVFCGASQNHIQALQALLLGFEAASGLKVNLTKSELVPVGNVPSVLSFANMLGCKVSNMPMKYFGLPLGASFKSLSIGTGVLKKDGA